MDVDTDNFHEVNKTIKDLDLIAKSEFISFDLEFTGVKFDNNEKDKYDMFLNEKYLKMASVASKFSIVQIGLTFLLKNQEGIQNQKCGKYTAYPFNFYVFPRDSPTNSPVISMQAGCVQFNSIHNMDWNRWIRKGITYVRISQFNKHMQGAIGSHFNSATITNNTELNQGFNTRTYNEILNDLNHRFKTIIEGVVDTLSQKQVGFKHSIEIPRFAISIIRRGVQAYANQHSLNLIITKSLCLQNEGDADLDVPTHQESVTLNFEIISEQRKMLQIQKQKQEVLGFSLIFQQIWNSNKLLVGHNCFYDLLFLYSSFVDELPRDYANFKKLVCPIQGGRRFFDTKFLAHQSLVDKLCSNGSSIFQLCNYFKQKEQKQLEKSTPKLQLAKGFQKYDQNFNLILHEAGFDSYMTAWLYLRLEALKQYENKIFIFKSYFNIDLANKGDFLRKDLKIFVVAIVLNNAYVQFEQLRTMRSNLSKSIRDQLSQSNLMNDVIVIDGFKEIFISMKDVNNTAVLVRFLLKLRKNKLIKAQNLMSLEFWVKMRADSQSLVTVTAKKISEIKQ